MFERLQGPGFQSNVAPGKLSASSWHFFLVIFPFDDLLPAMMIVQHPSSASRSAASFFFAAVFFVAFLAVFFCCAMVLLSYFDNQAFATIGGLRRDIHIRQR